MWRPNRSVTGTNDAPLANRRRWGGADDTPPPPPPPDFASPASSRDEKFGVGGGTASPRGEEPASDQPRKRRSRWGDATEKPVTALPTAIGGNVSQQELDNYAIHVRLQEINGKLQSGDVVPPERMRSPSPPPQYNAQGVRTNTREVRYRKKLEDERTRLIEKAITSDPNFKPPQEYHAAKRNNRPQEKVYIPKDEFPEINFFGLLVGPRGNSLKNMERQSGAKISIRGKGSVKPGKERTDQFADDENDELHCLVMADTQDKVDACVRLINQVIETAASTPEGQNEHKRNQLRELAALNGTLRDDENQLCQNCGEKGHRRFECPQQKNYAANIICRSCGGAGHMARDCLNKGGPPIAAPKSTFDSEYASLMAELGEGGNSSSGNAAGLITGPGGAPGGGNTPGSGAGDRPADPNSAALASIPGNPSRMPPWRIPENWFSNNPSRQQHGGMGYQGGQGGGYQGYQQQQAYPGYYQQNSGAVGGAAAYAGYGQAAAGTDPYAAYYASLQQAQTA